MFNILKSKIGFGGEKKVSTDWIKELKLTREDLEPELEMHRITNLDDVVRLMKERVTQYSPQVEIKGYFVNPNENNGRLTHLVFPTTPVIGVPLAGQKLTGNVKDGLYGPVFAVDKDNQLGLVFCPWQTFPDLKIIQERMFFVPIDKVLLGKSSLGDLLPEKAIVKFFSGKKPEEISPADIISLVQQEGAENKLEAFEDKDKTTNKKVTTLYIPLRYGGEGTILRHQENVGFFIESNNNNQGIIDSLPFSGKIHNHTEGKKLYYRSEDYDYLINHYGEKNFLPLNSFGDIESVFYSKDSIAKDTRSYFEKELSARIPISMVMAFTENGDYWGESAFDLYAAKNSAGFQRTKNLMLLAQELRKQQEIGTFQPKDLLKFYDEVIALSYINELPPSIGDK